MEFPNHSSTMRPGNNLSGAAAVAASFGLSTSEYQQLMSGSIGSVVPNQKSVVNFRDKPESLLAIDNANAIFAPPPDPQQQQQQQQLSRQVSPELEALTFVNPFATEPQVVASANTTTTNSNNSRTNKTVTTNAAKSSSRSGSQKANDIPDSYSAPIDESIFGDLQPIPINRGVPRNNKRKPSTSPTLLGSMIPRRSTSMTDIKPIITATSTTSSSSSSLSPPNTPSLLHQSCMLYPTTLTVVSSALGFDRANIRRRVPTKPNHSVRPRLPSTSTSFSQMSSNNVNKRIKKTTHESLYSLPIFIALENGASLPVLTALAKAGPDVLTLTDGPNGANALATALYLESSLDVINVLLDVNPECVQGLDRHNNTCLHVACEKGASLAIVDLLLTKWPLAISKLNFHQERPLDIAQRTNVCSLQVIDFLQQLVMDSLEQGASHLVSGNDDDDDDDLFLLS